MLESDAGLWSSPGWSSLPPQAARAPVSEPTSAVRATARRRGIVVVVFKAVPFLDVVAGPGAGAPSIPCTSPHSRDWCRITQRRRDGGAAHADTVQRTGSLSQANRFAVSRNRTA